MEERNNSENKSNVVFVGNLSWGTTSESLRRAFEDAGLKIADDSMDAATGRNVPAVSVAKDHATGRAKGYGFVNLSSPEEALRAIELMNGKDVDGREIRVQTKDNKPREERPARSRRNYNDGGDRGSANRW